MVAFHVAEKREPGRTCRIRFRPVMNTQDTANNILVDLLSEVSAICCAILGHCRSPILHPDGVSSKHWLVGF
jgi:hypothetical protein